MQMSQPKVPKFKNKYDDLPILDTSTTTQQSSLMVDFSNEFRQLAEDMMTSITQCRKSTIVVRKEQSELAKTTSDLTELLKLA